VNQFQVGEVCECSGPNASPGWHECVILALPGHDRFRGRGKHQTHYVIEIRGMPSHTDGAWQCPEHRLRKKRPPRGCDRKVEWQDCAWRPPHLARSSMT
jgi:hypothetical protein